MNRYVRLIVATFLLYSSCTGTADGPEQSQTTDTMKAARPGQDSVNTSSPVSEIRKEFQRINTAGGLSVKKIKWGTENCDIGGTASYFYENDQVVKIVVDGYEADGSWLDEYYYKNGKLIFIYEQAQYGHAPHMNETKINCRKYIRGDEVISLAGEGCIEGNLNERFGKDAKEYRLLKARLAKDITAIYCQ